MTSRTMRRLAGLALSLAVAGCATAPVTPPTSAPPLPVTTMAGLNAVIGRTATMLASQFGKAELDVREGTARKLQFVGPACILDAYLYPPAGGGEPIVTYVDARLPDGRDMDRASCVAALQAAQAPR